MGSPSMRVALMMATSVAASVCAIPLSYGPQHKPLASRECGGVARQRMDDTAANGYDAELQQAVYLGSYDDWWQRKARATIPQ